MLVIPIIGEIDWELANKVFVDAFAYLKENPKEDTFVVPISSDGGDDDAAWAIYKILTTFNRKVYTVGYSGVYSSAVNIFMAGEKRYVFSDTSFLFHPVTVLSEKGEQRGIHQVKEELLSDKIASNLFKEILKKYGVEPRTVSRMAFPKSAFFVDSVKAIKIHLATDLIEHFEQIK